MTRGSIAVFTALIGCGSLFAQSGADAYLPRSASHVEVKRLNDGDPRKLFRDRLNQLQFRSDLAGLVTQFRGQNGRFDVSQFQQLLQDNPELLDRAKELLKGINWNDPQYTNLIQEILRQNGLPFSPDLVLRQLQRLQQEGGLVGAGDAEAMLIPKPRRTPSETRDANSESEFDDLRRSWARNLANWARQIPRDRLAAPLRDSPALKKLLEDLSGVATGRRRPGSEGLDVHLARWQKRWESVRDWLPREWPEQFKLNFSGINASNVRLPNLDLGGPRGASSAMPVLGSIAEWLPVLYVAIAALVVFAIVRVLRARRILSGAAAAAGPWPLAPGSVGSREQLIRAFDYLAVLRCGRKAETWHHRAVASHLPRNDAERDPVRELAALYERARYAPDVGELPEEELAQARRHLRTLSEAAA
jgi:hypothetical protein